MVDPRSLLPPSRSENERIDGLLELLNLTRVAKAPVAALPLGISRLVEVGRALASQPDLVLLDEPLSGLDIKASENLLEVFRRVVDQGEREVSLLIVEHDVAAVLALSSRIFVLDFGERIAAGSPEEIRSDPVVRAAYLGDDEPHPQSQAPTGTGTGTRHRGVRARERTNLEGDGPRRPLRHVPGALRGQRRGRPRFGARGPRSERRRKEHAGADRLGTGPPGRRQDLLRRQGRHGQAPPPHPQARLDLHPRGEGDLPRSLGSRQPSHGRRAGEAARPVGLHRSGHRDVPRARRARRCSAPEASPVESSRCSPSPEPSPSHPS